MLHRILKLSLLTDCSSELQKPIYSYIRPTGVTSIGARADFLYLARCGSTNWKTKRIIQSGYRTSDNLGLEKQADERDSLFHQNEAHSMNKLLNRTLSPDP